MSDKNVSDMTDDEIRAMAGAAAPATSGLDWPAARRAIDVAITRARREILSTVDDALADLGHLGEERANIIGGQVQDSLDDIDQTIPPEADDE